VAPIIDDEEKYDYENVETLKKVENKKTKID